MTETNPPKKSDLGVRVLSAIVMVAVAGTALWLGGWFWTLFVVAVGLGVLWEWWGLVRGFVQSAMGRAAWLICGLVYVGLTMFALLALRGEPDFGLMFIGIFLLGVIGTDVGAYFVGRTFGGPKIAPAISPSKTWSGLLGGIFGASAAIWLATFVFVQWHMMDGLTFQLHGDQSTPDLLTGVLAVSSAPKFLLIGGPIAVVAQAGDFFESWMKRRAGVKDSSNLIPGHGGLFDRVDGLIAVLSAVALLHFGTLIFAL